jgi:hypothetical protein
MMKFISWNSSPNFITIIKSKRIKWGGHIIRMREDRKANRLLVEKPRKETTWKITRLVDNIKMALEGIGLGGID